LIALLARTEGATVEEMAAALDWQQHTIRGVMSGALVKRFGLRIVSEKIEGRDRTYRIEDAAEGDASPSPRITMLTGLGKGRLL
jgi:hypothetical protein